MKIVEFNPASPDATPEGLVQRFGSLSVSMGGLVVRCDYDHPITKKPYARAFFVPEVTFLFAMLHEATDSLISAKIAEVIGLSILKDCEQDQRPDIVRWLRAKVNIVEHRSSVADMALLVNLEKPLDFLDGQE